MLQPGDSKRPGPWGAAVGIEEEKEERSMEAHFSLSLAEGGDTSPGCGESSDGGGNPEGKLPCIMVPSVCPAVSPCKRAQLAHGRSPKLTPPSAGEPE